MSKLILRYRKPGPIPDSEKQRIYGLQDTFMIDEAARMLLVEGSEDALRSLLDPSDWSITPDGKVAAPDPRKRSNRNTK
jgi:hypothetical protein